MRERSLPSQNNAGIALVTSLAILTIVGMLILGAVLTTQIELGITRNDATAAQAQYAAQAGLQKYKAALFQNFRWGSSGGGTAFACENTLSVGLNLQRTVGGMSGWVNNRITLPTEQVTDVDGNVIGVYDITFIRDPNNDSRISVQSIGRTIGANPNSRATARATATFIIRNSSAAEQAVFAGTGHGMKFFNGNTNVYGGIHIVGDINNPDAYVIEAKGNSAVLNGYTAAQTSGANVFLVDDALEVPNLCASVRVQYGRVDVSGSTSFGTSSNPLLTVAVGDNPNDITVKDTDCSGKGICAESIGTFDLGDAPPVFPILDVSPGTELCPEPNTWRSCIRSEAHQDGITFVRTGDGSVVVSGPLADYAGRLSNACTSVLNAAARSSNSSTLIFDKHTNLDCTITVDSRQYGFTYGGGTFRVFGNVNIRGLSLQFDESVKFSARSRAADGALQNFAGLSIEQHAGYGGDFVTLSSFVADSNHGKFPSNVLSVIAERDVKLLGKNGDSFTLPIYAGGDLMVSSGTRLFGQAISDRFCTVSPNGNAGATCSDKGGSPADIFFVPTGEHRPRSFRAIAPTGGLPTFRIEAYELR